LQNKGVLLMSDFNQTLEVGDFKNGFINTVIEIPMGSNLKIEWDRKRAAFMLDRVEPAIFPKPVNYGFIPQTIDEDGDELDTLVLCDYAIPTGVWLKAKIIGVLNFVDDGDNDYKIICVPADNRDNNDLIQDFNDLDQRWKQKVEFHFNHYKDLKKFNSTEVKGWEDEKAAIKIISECQKRFLAK
jgi:inorganic pyrophosphatase